MEICTIGTAKRSAESFFGALTAAGVQAVLDTRLRASSQLAGFTQARDLSFFVPRLVGAQYAQVAELAPTAAMLDDYKHRRLGWEAYAGQYLDLLERRQAALRLQWLARFDRVALVCTEPAAERCHRRLAAEHLADRWPGASVAHL